MTERQLLYLSRHDVEAVGVSMAEILTVLETAFREKAEGRVEMPPKPGVHPRPDSFLHAMPAWVPALRSVGAKWVSGYPGNAARGLPYISGLMLLNDPDTGLPIAVMDAIWITAMRTGAATGLSARSLARQDSRTLGMLGCGVQGRTNLTALLEVLPIDTVLAYDVDGAALRRYQDEVEAKLPVKVVPVGEPQQAVSGCDVVVTAGPIVKPPHATIRAGWMDRGAFASLVDFDSYWEPAALHQSDKFCTDDREQLLHYRELGYFQDIPPIHAELGDLLVGRAPGRESEAERTLACNLGVGLADVATARLVYDRAVERGVGRWLPL